MANASLWLTPPDVAEQLGIDVHKVLAWLKSGELAAVDLAEKRGGRPRYRIARESLDRFLSARQVSPRTKPVRRTRKGFNRKYYV